MKTSSVECKRILCAAALALGSFLSAGERTRIALDFEKPGHEIPKTLYGVFFEDINQAADGGIYPELVSNRGFDWETDEWKPGPFPHQDLSSWSEDFRGGAMARISRQYGKPVHPATARHLRVEVFGAGTGCGIRNDGFGGMAVRQGEKYDLSFYARGLDGYKGGISVLLEDANGEKLASFRVENADMSVSEPSKNPNEKILPDWKRFNAVLVPSKTTANAHLSLLLDKPGIVEFEQVSLFPQDTWKGRRNGLRKDMVQMLADLKPGVFRFPGGCIAEGCDFGNWYDWKRSVGDGSLESRPTNWNLWGYWQTHGLGYFEYFQLCEDLGAEPLPIVIAGMTCQFRQEEYAPMDSMDYFVQNIFDLIEFANGPADSKWGSLRAKMGHPEPFNMKYVGIGNENWDKGFLERYDVIARKVRAKHPEIRIVSSSGAGPGPGGVFELAWKTLTPETADVIDEHSYANAAWFLSQTTRYDSYDRNGCKAYLGEYACNGPRAGNTLFGALCEAAMMTGFERNSDVVEMTSYAPLFAKATIPGWRPDLIFFDNTRVVGTPNYYVQKLFSRNRPTTLVPSAHDAKDSYSVAMPGDLTIRTWKTALEIRNVSIENADGAKILPQLSALDGWKGRRSGDWSAADGGFRQTKTDGEFELRAGTRDLLEGVVRLQFRKIGGEEGVILVLRDESPSPVRLNLGGWGNTAHAFEGGPNGVYGRKEGRIETGKWNDLEIELKKDRVSVKLNGEQLYKDIEIPGANAAAFYSVAGYDKETGEIVVKCVNLSETPRTAEIDFGGRSVPAQDARKIVLSGSPDMENTLDNPNVCVPKEETFRIEGGTTAQTELAPSSLTVLRFKAE